MAPNRLLWFTAFFLFLIPVSLDAQYSVEIENVQLARSLAGVVVDPLGAPIPGVLVEEVGPDWKESSRSTTTDKNGSFVFAPVSGRRLYYFQLRQNGFNPLLVRVKVDRRRGQGAATHTKSRRLADFRQIPRIQSIRCPLITGHWRRVADMIAGLRRNPDAPQRIQSVEPNRKS